MNSMLACARGYLSVAALAGGVVASSGCAGSISTQEEVRLGAQAATEIERELPILEDRAVNSYINQLGNSIARGADPRGLNYRFRVVDADEVNAFAVPGGFIYINRGLIDRASNMSELAGVLAHEIGHVVERHSVERMEKAQGANALASVVYGVLLGRNPSGIEQVGLQVGGGALFAHYSRDAEREADAVAVPYLIQAGINPQGLVSMHQKLLEERRRSPGAVDRWFSTHPQSEERIENVNQAIAALPRGTLNNLTTQTRAFQEFQARVRQLAGRGR